MNYDELKAQCGDTGKKLVKIGDGIHATNVIIAMFIFIFGFISAIAVADRSSKAFMYIGFGTLLVGISYIALGFLVKILLHGFGELVTNTEIIARKNCEQVSLPKSNDIKKEELPDL